MAITLKNFENIVDPKVLDRGARYQKNGAVAKVEELDKNDFNAIVLGSETYMVNIVLNRKGEIFTHECNCPYDFGAVCKHKVAVLLSIREMTKNGTAFKKGNLTKIKNELKKRKKEELIQLLINLAKPDIGTRNNLLFELGFEVDDDEEYY